MNKTESAAGAAAAPATVVRSIYGQDDRIDLFRVLDRRVRNDADAVVSLFRSTMLRQEKNGDWTVLGMTLGDRLNLCPDQNFVTQRSASFASGVLVARDVIATAGHAIKPDEDRDAVALPDIRFVFGYAMRDDTTLETIKQGNVYRGVELIAKQHFSGGEDWALVRLDRPVKDHRIASLRRSAKMPTGTAVHIIGHPNGLPVKVASGTVTRNTALDVFEANFDALAGNSGSPVFNSVTHEVEGIYVRGLSAWETQERGSSGCNEFRVWRVDQASEVSTRSTVFTPRLGPGWQEVDDNPLTKAIAVGAQPGPIAGPVLYQLHTNGSLWRYNGTPMVGWELLDTNPNTVEVATDGVELYQRQSGNGSIWRFTGAALTGWQQVGGNPLTKQIVTGRRHLYQLQNDGLLWRYTGTPMIGWELLDRNAATTAIAADGDRLFQLHRTTGAIWQYTGTPLTGWSLLGANPLTTSILASGGQLYRLQSDGQLWRYTGTPLSGWELLDTNRLTVAIAHDGLRLYQLHRTTGAVWRYTGTPLTGWQQLDDDPTTKAIHAAGRQLYQRTQRPRSGARAALGGIKRLVP